MGWLVGIEPTITGPQPAVLPLHHSHHGLSAERIRENPCFGKRRDDDYTHPMTQPETSEAILYATTNKEELKRSQMAGCYYCCRVFRASEVVDFLAEENTAVCPKCGIDSVLPDTAGYPLTTEVLQELHRHWF